MVLVKQRLFGGTGGALIVLTLDPACQMGPGIMSFKDLLCVYDMGAPKGQGPVQVASCSDSGAVVPITLRCEGEILSSSSPLSQ